MSALPKSNRWTSWTARLALIAICAVGLFYAAKNLKIIQMAHAQVIATPFLLQLDIYDGNGTVFKKSTIARNSDGTTAMMESVGPLSAGQFARKIVYLDGRSLSIVDAIRSRTVWPNAPAKQVAFLRNRLSNPPKDCEVGRAGTVLRADQIMGENVSVVEAVSGEYRLTHWSAPRLGCESIYYRSEKRNPDGSYSLSAEAKPVVFVVGEPDAKYFDPGASYEDMKPSAVQTKFFQQMGLEENKGQQDRQRKLDEKYGQRR